MAVQKIPFELATPGMRLAKAVKAVDGSDIAAEGEPLTAAVLKRLGMMGLSHLVVEGSPVPGYGMGYDVAARFERLTYLFRNHQDNVFMVTLAAFLKKHFQERR